ncbi:esterase-like activity of phytase family protein [uncultured Sphingomonas sp.]|uniref:esterase-like activity of phytase family protein n=1 Tax=uncultured Sphingomonas sp. TaxID=158754 RepID=UPI0035C94760
MGRVVRAFLSLLLVLLIVPGWSGDERLKLPGDAPRLTVERVALNPDDPAMKRVGALTFLGGVALGSDDPAFGGFSALLVDGERFTLLSDGGNLLRFRMGADWRPRGVRFDPLPAGPGTGWRKSDRDSEAVAIDPRTGRMWVAFENDNAIWRYAPGFARGERWRRSGPMARWPEAGGAESMTRLRDGRFLAISETRRPPRGVDGRRPETRVGLIFAGDPTGRTTRIARFSYRPERGHHPVDMAELPDGRLLVLERRFALPFRWRTRVALVAPSAREMGAVRAGAVVSGRTVARLVPPLLTDNFEGIAVAQEGGAIVVWLVSDDNQLPVQRTLLLKFRLDREGDGKVAARRRTG